MKHRLTSLRRATFALFAFALVAFSGGSALWSSDGTPAGTTPIRRLGPAGANGSDAWPLLAAAGKLFFPAWDRVHGWELWALAPPPAATGSGASNH